MQQGITSWKLQPCIICMDLEVTLGTCASSSRGAMPLRFSIENLSVLPDKACLWSA